MLKIEYITNQGKRKSNEDALLIEHEIVTDNSRGSIEIKKSKALFMVADGMGGHGHGAYASKLILEAFQGDFNLECNLKEAKKSLNQALKKGDASFGFGAVLAGVYIDNNNATIFNCGDSRVYRYAYGFLEQLSYDHSLVQKLVEQGEIESCEQRTHPQRNQVSSALCGDGELELPEIYTQELKLKEDEVFLICSDGLWESADIEVLERCFFSFDSVIEDLEKLVVSSYCEDNFSFIVVENIKN